jgi:hypothetical protein
MERKRFDMPEGLLQLLVLKYDLRLLEKLSKL